MEVEQIHDFILEATKANEILGSSVIQNLWSGYGSIKRYDLEGSDYTSVIVKHVEPDQGSHPRGWNTDLSHQRKLKSYQVELNWYESRRNYSKTSYARIPFCLAAKKESSEVLMVLEDLDALGFEGRRSFVNHREWHACVRWLAAFMLKTSIPVPPVYGRLVLIGILKRDRMSWNGWMIHHSSKQLLLLIRN